MLISIIFPTYNESENLNELYDRVAEETGRLSGHEFEFLFVDDASTDSSAEIIAKLHKKDPRVKLVRFARNCGSHAAIAAGLHYCRGQAAVTLAADLQDPPSVIGELLKAHGEGNTIVWGARRNREGESWLTKAFSRMYYFLLKRLTDIRMPESGTDIFLADRAVINAFKEVREKHTSVFLTLAWLGFQQAVVFYDKEARFSGRSKWTLSKKWKLLMDSLLAFSDAPIRTMSTLGVLTAFLGFLYAVVILANYLIGNPVQGWSSLMMVILVIGGVQMMMLGMLGEYLWRTFDESRQRPRYVIQDIIE